MVDISNNIHVTFQITFQGRFQMTFKIVFLMTSQVTFQMTFEVIFQLAFCDMAFQDFFFHFVIRHLWLAFLQHGI